MENKKYIEDVLNYFIQATKDIICGDKIKIKCPNYKDYGLEDKDVEEVAKIIDNAIQLSTFGLTCAPMK